MKARSQILRCLEVLVLFVIALAMPIYAESVPVVNPSFEEGLADNGLPLGWPSLFSVKTFDKEITLSDVRAKDGKYSIRIEDLSSEVSAGLRSAPIPATEGVLYTASAQGFIESGTTQLYLEFWNEKGERIDMIIGSSDVVGTWAPVTAQKRAPTGTKTITLLIYGHRVNVGVAYYDCITLEAGEKSVAKSASSIENIPLVSFDLSQAPLGVTSLADVRARVPEGRPRLFARPETLQALREKRTRSVFTNLVWREIGAKALVASVMGLPKEPPSAMPGGVFDVVAWREGITIASEIVEYLDALAFSYLMTGDERYSEPGKKLLLHVSRWDPNGTSSRSINDEVSMRLLYSMSRAYDWLYPALTPDERLLVQNTMRERGNDVYKKMRSIKFENTLLDNHLVRTMGFLGQAAIAFLGDFPEAEIWFDYIVGLFLVKYPAFGDDEGGWSQGVSYWQSYISWVLEYLDALKIATGLDLYQKPFFRNTAYFKLYAHPPKSKFGAFGDHSDGAPGDGAASVVSRFAQVYQDPALQWYVHQISGMGKVPIVPMKNFLGYIWSPESADETVSPFLPSDYPQSRLFSDVGWALMNNKMDDWQNNVHVKFKSSPYGSFNHSHAEQNSFMIEAYGSPLAISSGYYPWYGSPHHKTWTWESRSKNTILVDGVGQGVQNINAKGDIVDASFGKQYDYVLGDATQAYMGRIERFWRHMWFIKPNIIAVFDQLEAGRSATYDWLLHSQKQMEIDESVQRVRVPADTAEMWTYFVTPGGLQISQTDQFTVLPEDRDAGKDLQWHLTAKATSDTGIGRFLTIMIPRPMSQFKTPAPSVSALSAVNGYAAHVDMEGQQYSIAFRDAQGNMEVAGYATDAVAIAWWKQDAQDGFMAIGLQKITQGDHVLFQSDHALDIGVLYARGAEGLVLELQLPPDAVYGKFAVSAGSDPVKVVINGEELPRSSWSTASGLVTVSK